MTTREDRALEPPGWVSTVFRCLLPCDGMRDAILGDLHEEFTRDVTGIGLDRARIRYRNRALGIFAHAVWDSVRWRTWASNHEARESGYDSDGAGAPVRPPRGTHGRRSIARRTGLAGGYLGVGIAVFAILGVGVVVNTSVFAAVDGVPASDDVPAEVRAALTLAPERAPAEAETTRTAAVAAAVVREETAGLPLPALFTLVALGAVGVVVMIGCAALAAIVLCRAPAWGRLRAARGPWPVSPPVA